MKVNIEFIKYLEEHRRKINSVPLSEIEWIKDNVEIKIDAGIIEDFEFMGLNNIDFITTGFYLAGWDNEEKKNETR